DPIAEDITVLAHDVAEIDAHPKCQPPIFWNCTVSFRHRLLQANRAAHRLNGAGELREDTVSGRLNYAATMLLDPRPDDGSQELLQLLVGPFLVTLHQAAVADDISCEDRRQSSFGSGSN